MFKAKLQIVNGCYGKIICSSESLTQISEKVYEATNNLFFEGSDFVLKTIYFKAKNNHYYCIVLEGDLSLSDFDNICNNLNTLNMYAAA